MRAFIVCVAVVAATFTCSSALAQDTASKKAGEFFFQSGDRVMFLGDSITEQYEYSSYIELYLTTRFPAGNMKFLNAGISGDTANGGAGRFKTHVLDEQPTAVTINFGMNDGGYGAFNPQGNETYVKRTTEMCEAAKKAGVRVALISPNAVDPRCQERFKLYLETQKQFYAPLKEIAAKTGARYVDQYGTTRKELEEMAKKDPEAKTLRPFGDGFHTSPPGGLVMAHAILTGLDAPALVSNVAIDGNKVQATKCKVDKLKVTPTSVSFERLDEAIPMPVQKNWSNMLPYLNDLDDLNYYGLTVKGLAPGKYDLKIDNDPIGQYDADDLAKGVNLGNLQKGELFEQGNLVLKALTEKNRKLHERFRQVVMYDTNSIPGWAKAEVGEKIAQLRKTELETRLADQATRQAAIYKLATPAPHTFTLTAATR